MKRQKIAQKLEHEEEDWGKRGEQKKGRDRGRNQESRWSISFFSANLITQVGVSSVDQ